MSQAEAFASQVEDVAKKITDTVEVGKGLEKEELPPGPLPLRRQNAVGNLEPIIQNDRGSGLADSE